MSNHPPMAKVTSVTAFPLRGPIRDKLYNPEGIEDSRNDVGLPTDPAEQVRFRALVEGALRGGPPGRA